MLAEQRHDGVRVEYEAERIVLQGEDEAVRHEAQRILRLFQFTGRPYRLSSGSRGRMILTRAY